MPKYKSLLSLKDGGSAKIVELSGGNEFVRRMHALGVREGKVVEKLSQMFMKGPVTIQVGHTQISLGHGMASKIMVEVS
jgi:ferrous iron transport protein A